MKCGSLKAAGETIKKNIIQFSLPSETLAKLLIKAA